MFLHEARTDPRTAAAAQRIAEYHNPRKPAGPTAIEQVGAAIKPYVLPVVGGLTGCASGANAGAQYGPWAGGRAAGAAAGCLVNGVAGVFSVDLVKPHQSGQPPSYP